MKKMNRWISFVVVIIFVCSLSLPPSENVQAQTVKLDMHQIVVKFKDGIKQETKNKKHQAKQVKMRTRNTQLGFDVIDVQKESLEQVLKTYKEDHAVDYVEPIIELNAMWTPNDPIYQKEQYGPQMIQAEKAWDITRGKEDIIVAVIDTGVQTDHPDLTGQIIEGYDFVDNDRDAYDEQGHGTHVAGTVGALTHNGIGVAGIAPHVKIMPIRVLGANGSGTSVWVANGITYAADNGADVINLSLGADQPSKVIEDAVNYAWDKGAVVLGAAGNSGESTPSYPANHDKVIAVGATNAKDQKWSASNYGTWVDVSAPGAEIISTTLAGGYGYDSGTSMATPHVAGLAALLSSEGLSNAEIRSTIENSADPISGTGTYWKHGRVNAYEALKETKAFQNDQVSVERIYEDIADLAYKDDARMAGTKGEMEAANKIKERWIDLGYEVEMQPHLLFSHNSGSIDLKTPISKSIEARPFIRTPTHSGQTASLVYAGLGSRDDFDHVDVKGKIALIKRGSFTYAEKVQNAADNGAIGVIIFNNTGGLIYRGGFNQVPDIPTIGISGTDGTYLVDLLKEEAVSLHMKVDDTEVGVYTHNVIATKSAVSPTDETETFVVGAHYDGVDSAAANDNASGTATMLEVARIVSNKDLNQNIKFIAFGAEELGLLGSNAYIDSLNQTDIKNMSGMLNMDMVGVGDTLRIYTAKANASSWVADRAEDIAKMKGIRYQRGTSSRSDHVPFEEQGIPVAFLHYEEDPYYHTDQDTLDKIQKEDLFNTGQIVTQIVNQLN
ncbi:DUF4910 domain-containing protein [Hazenella sp. IB182357]|uniref:DUF4910 domain-containing protein n=1 Tax=Polycladospora coralii TaxID=2771432 RepID=A0A926N6I9_9BACL|nr:DUF4910 domain-containing protein [Polycladospora coralii]MBD1373009.1 DUF4910 domain-containing protein [Polycladospora coralii]